MKKLLFAVLIICSPMLAQAQPTEAGSSDSQGAKKFVDQFWSEWSGPNSDAMPYIQSAIDDQINFYGKSISRDAYMKVQVAFAKRWPDRQYTVQPGSEDINCDQGTSTCNVKGIVGWKDFSPERNSLSTGSANFSFSLREQTVDGTILYLLTSESGSVISRSLSQATSVPATGGVPSSQSPVAPSATMSVMQGINLTPIQSYFSNYSTDEKSCDALNGIDYTISFDKGAKDTLKFSTIFKATGTTSPQTSCEIELEVDNNSGAAIFKNAWVQGAIRSDGSMSNELNIMMRQYPGKPAFLFMTEILGADGGGSDLRVFEIGADKVTSSLFVSSLYFSIVGEPDGFLISGRYNDGSCNACMPTKSVKIKIDDTNDPSLSIDESGTNDAYFQQLASDTVSYFHMNQTAGLSDFLLNDPYSDNSGNISGLNYGYGAGFSPDPYPTLNAGDPTVDSSNSVGVASVPFYGNQISDSAIAAANLQVTDWQSYWFEDEIAQDYSSELCEPGVQFTLHNNGADLQGVLVKVIFVNPDDKTIFSDGSMYIDDLPAGLARLVKISANQGFPDGSASCTALNLVAQVTVEADAASLNAITVAKGVVYPGFSWLN